MRIAHLLLLVAVLSGLGTAQVQTYVTVNDDVAAGTSMQLYFDFLATSAVAGVPPLIPDDEDALIIIDPLPEDTTANAFVAIIANELNDYFRKRGMSYSVTDRERGGQGEKAKDATIVISSPTVISSIYASADSLTPPSSEVSASPGISFNPFIGNATQKLTQAFAGTANAQLFINGMDPTQDVTHQVEVFAPGPLKFSFLSGSNPFQPVTFMISGFYNPENIPASFVSFPGSLDIGTFNNGFQNITFVADSNFGGTGSLLDGFFVTNSQGVLDFQVSLGLGHVGNQIAAQAIIADPTIAPVGLSFTQAADIHMSVGQEQILQLGDNGTASVPFIPGTTFDFYGATYSGVTISANGYVSLGGPLGIPNDQIVNPAAALGAAPAIFANWSDWDTSGVGVTVRQFGAELRINWGTPQTPISHPGSADSGAFSLVLHLNVPPGVAPPSQREAVDGAMSIADAAGSAFIDILRLDNNGVVASFDSLTGISPGSLPPGATVINRAFDEPFFPNLGGIPILSQHNVLNQASSVLNVASGGPPLYSNGATLAGNSLHFFPRTGPGGAAGYASVPSGHPVDDIQGANVTSLSINANAAAPTPFNLIGYFRYLFSFDPNLPAPKLSLVDDATGASLAVVGFAALMTPNGAQDAGVLVAAPTTTGVLPGYRPFEGVQVVLPQGSLSNVPPGTSARIKVEFPNGNALFSRQTILIN